MFEWDCDLVVCTLDGISGHFRSIQSFFNKTFFTKWPPAPPFCISEIYVRSHFWPFQIDMQLYFVLKFLTKCRPYWMSEIHFRTNFWLFQIDELFYKMAAGGHFGCPKFTFDHISSHFGSIGYLRCLKFTFDRISGHFRSISHFGCPKFTFDAFLAISESIRIIFFNFWQNGRRRPFWMSENNFDRISGHFRSIGHFGCAKFTFDRISGHFRSISHFGCPKFTFDGISDHFRIHTDFFFKFLTIYIYIYIYTFDPVCPSGLVTCTMEVALRFTGRMAARWTIWNGFPMIRLVTTVWHWRPRENGSLLTAQNWSQLYVFYKFRMVSNNVSTYLWIK